MDSYNNPRPGLPSTERELIQLDAKMQILRSRVETLESRYEKRDITLEEVHEQLQELKADIKECQKRIAELLLSVKVLDDNVFLQFTNDIDLKKLFTIIITVASIVASPAVVSNWFDNESKQTDALKMDKIIQLLEENAK